jgi:sugar phosphate isomerase/epimerase
MGDPVSSTPRLCGVSTLAISGPDLAEACAAVAAAGFREIELYCPAEHLPGWLADPGAARRAIIGAGLVARSLHCPSAGWDNSSPNEEKRRAAGRAAAACLPLAAEVGAGVVVWHPTISDYDYRPETAPGHIARALDALAEFASRARAAGLCVAVENLPRRGTTRPLCSVEALLPFIAPLGEGVGICLDAGHSNANGLVAADEARLAGAKLIALHIQDNDGKGEDQHLLPEEGTTDWPAFLRALEAVGYRGGRIFEVEAVGRDSAAKLAALAELAGRWRAPSDRSDRQD